MTTIEELDAVGRVKYGIFKRLAALRYQMRVLKKEQRAMMPKDYTSKSNRYHERVCELQELSAYMPLAEGEWERMDLAAAEHAKYRVDNEMIAPDEDYGEIVWAFNKYMEDEENEQRRTFGKNS